MNETENIAISQLIDKFMDEEPNSVEISDQIKDILLSKSAEKIEAIRPSTYNTIFDEDSAE